MIFLVLVLGFLIVDIVLGSRVWVGGDKNVFCLVVVENKGEVWFLELIRRDLRGLEFF